MMKKSRILLVEDEIDLGNVVRQYLEISDFEVKWVTNGRLAFEQLRLANQEYQIALIDVAMPEMDGFQLADKIVQLGIRLPFLFLTARNERSDRLHGLKIGADDYISKPFDVDELVLRIRNIIKRCADADMPQRPVIVRGDVEFNKDSLQLSIKPGHEIVLTPREAELLLYLFGHE